MKETEESMPDLPEGWAWTKFEEIAKLNYRDPAINSLPDDFMVTFLPMAAVDAKKGIIAKPEKRPLAQVRKGFTPFSEKDVLFAKITPSMENGKAAIAYGLVNGRGFGSTEFHVISPEEGILSEWLFYFIRQEKFRRDAKANFAGTAGQLRVPADFIKKYPIPIAPLPEQLCIVSKIDELFSRLDAGVEALQRAKAQLWRYRQAVLKAAVEGRLTEEWRKAHPEVEPAEELVKSVLNQKEVRRNNKEQSEFYQDFDEMPATWTWANLGMLKQFSLYGPRFSSNDYSEKGYAVLRTSDISDSGKVNTKTAPLLPLDKEDFLKYKVEKGDLLITRTGSLGTLAVFNDDVDAIPGAYLIQYRLIMDPRTSWYIFYFLKSPSGQKKLLAGGAGVGRPNLNAPTIEAIPIPFPPLDEQEIIIMEIEKWFTISYNLQSEIEANVSYHKSFIRRSPYDQ